MHNQNLKASLISQQYSPSLLSWAGNLDSPQSFFASKPVSSPIISPKNLEDELKMPLILFPKNHENSNRWVNIATDILRTIKAEYSFAKKSELVIRRINHKDSNPIRKNKVSNETKKQSSNDKSILVYFASLKNRKDQETHKLELNISPIIKIDTLAHIVPRSDTITRIVFTGKKLKHKQSKIGSQILNFKEFEKQKSFDQISLEEEDSQSLQFIHPQIDMNRRKSCEGGIFGRSTSFHGKIELTFPRFQTRHQQKKLDLERQTMEMDANHRMNKSIMISKNAGRKTKNSTKKENLSVILLKNQNKASSIQIKNLINSSMRSSTLRRSVGLDETEQTTYETSNFSKKQIAGVIEEEKPEQRNKYWSIDEENMPQNENPSDNNLNNINDIHSMEFFEKRDSKKSEEDVTSNLSPVRRVTLDISKNHQELKPLTFRRAQTYYHEKDSNLPKPDSQENADNKRKRNIELVYNQVSPEKIQAKSILNSPSERTRANTSIKRKYLTGDFHVEPKNIKEEKPEVFLEKKLAKESHIIPKTEFTEILQKNTPKYTFFTSRNQQKKEPKESPLSHIYHSKVLLNILKVQKLELGKDLLSKKRKTPPSLNFTVEKAKHTSHHSNSSNNFKIRKVSNSITTRDDVDRNLLVGNIPKKETKHRKFKSNVTFKTEEK